MLVPIDGEKELGTVDKTCAFALPLDVPPE
jgi:hypothetical protein